LSRPLDGILDGNYRLLMAAMCAPFLLFGIPEARAGAQILNDGARWRQFESEPMYLVVETALRMACGSRATG
jgi:hypothetical protein